jgi:hypothetical protein
MSEHEFGRRDLFKRLAAGAGAAGIGVGTTSLTQQAAAQDAPVLAKKVPTHKLGTTGEDIPILLMGGSHTFDPTYDKMLHRAFKLGMYYFDGGYKYGSGKLIKSYIEQVGRDKVWITSKSGLWGGNDASPASRYYDDFQNELKDLGTDHVNMYFMHGIKHMENLDKENLDMFDRLKKEGKTKYTGFSCHDGNVVELMNKAAQIGSDAINAIMFRYSFAQYGNTELNKAMDACKKAGIGLLAMKAQELTPKDSDFLTKFQSENFTLPQAKLKAVWADERIDACVSGITNLKLLKENSNAARSQMEVTAKEMSQMMRFAAETAHLRCKGCSHICESRVASDLKISDQLRYLMYDECYGNHDEAKGLYAALADSERDFDSVDLTAATAACPQGINIGQRLSDAKSRLA